MAKRVFVIATMLTALLGLDLAINSSAEVDHSGFTDRVAILSEVTHHDEFVSVGTILKALGTGLAGAGLAIQWAWSKIDSVRIQHQSEINGLRHEIRDLNQRLTLALQESAALRASVESQDRLLHRNPGESAVRELTVNINAKTHHITSIDGDCFNLLGFQRSELLEQNVACLIPPAFRAQHTQALELARQTGTLRNNAITGQILAKDGTLIDAVILLRILDNTVTPTFSARIFALV